MRLPSSARAATRLALFGLALAPPRPASAIPGPTLPAPTGRAHVGTTIHVVTDSARVDLVTHARGRQVAVQLWYPTSATSGAIARYIPEPRVVDAMLASAYLRLDSATINAWRDVATHARLDAPISGRQLPLLVLSHGQGLSRSHYTALAEELASHGYVVAAIDHPYGGMTVLPDGRALTLADDPAPAQDDSVLVQRTAEWAGDASAVVTRLLDPRTALGRATASHIDPARVGMIGHSLGGAAALATCQGDPRFRACADLDGALFGQPLPGTTRRPMLVMRSQPAYSDADLAKRGRTRAEWDAMGRDVDAHFREALSHARGEPMYMVVVRNTGHMSFSDAPFTFPDALTRFGGQPLAAARTLELTSTVLRAFLDATLRDGPADALERVAAAAPELTLTRVAPRP